MPKCNKAEKKNTVFLSCVRIAAENVLCNQPTYPHTIDLHIITYIQQQIMYNECILALDYHIVKIHVVAHCICNR